MAQDARAANFEALVEQLRQRTARRENLVLRVYDGPGDIAILVQEQQLQNADLMDEHWSEVWNPEQAQRKHISVRRAKEGMAITLMVVAGDKAAGKTTFFAALTSGSLHILQAFRYNRASFFNVWYAPTTEELTDLLDTPDRAEPYFQTALAHGFLHLPMPEYNFFCADDVFFSEGDDLPGPLTADDEGPQDMLVKMLEIGGDFIQELMTLLATPGAPATDPTKASILSSVLQYLQQCHSLAYFVNLDALFHPSSSSVQVNTAKLQQTLAQFDFLSSVLPSGAQVLVYCSREPDHLPPPGWSEAFGKQLTALMTALSEEPGRALVDQMQKLESTDPASVLRRSVELLLRHEAGARHWGLRLRGFYPTRHLDENGAYDYDNVLRTLHRLMKTSTGVVLNQIGLVAQQVVNVAYDFWETADVATAPPGSVWFTKGALYAILDDDSDSTELDDVLHPMVVLPPMVLLDAFDDVVALLVRQGLALQYYNGRTTDLALRFIAEGLPPLEWRAEAPKSGLAAPTGFRLPLHPASRRMVRQAVDLMGSVEGLEHSALARHVLADLPRVVATLEQEMQTAVGRMLACAPSDHEPSDEEDGFSPRLHHVLWLVEEWVLAMRMRPGAAVDQRSYELAMPVAYDEGHWLGKQSLLAPPGVVGDQPLLTISLHISSLTSLAR